MRVVIDWIILYSLKELSDVLDNGHRHGFLLESGGSPTIAGCFIESIGSGRSIDAVLSNLGCRVVSIPKALESYQVLLSVEAGIGAELEVDLV